MALESRCAADLCFAAALHHQALQCLHIYSELPVWTGCAFSLSGAALRPQANQAPTSVAGLSRHYQCILELTSALGAFSPFVCASAC